MVVVQWLLGSWCCAMRVLKWVLGSVSCAVGVGR